MGCCNKVYYLTLEERLKIIGRLAYFIKGRPEVSFAYVYGSFAKGMPFHDIDTGIRLCNCCYDDTIETEKYPLFIANLGGYQNFKELLDKNTDKIEQIRTNFIRGKLPSLCRKCPFYVPQR